MIHLGRLDLLRWGCFTDQTLAFGDPDGRLHLVYGGNTAGKSTTRRGTSALLFGIPGRTEDAHTHDYQDLRIGAQLLTDAGSVEVIRRKGNVNTLLGPDGQPLGDDPIGTALGGLTGQVYAGLFEISHESLVEGGRDLLAGHGAVGESLFAAAAGTGRLHRLLLELDAEAADLFKPTGRTAPLNVALSEYSQAMKQMNAETVRPSAAIAMRRALKAALGRIEELDGEIRQYDEQRGRLRRLKAVKPLLARHASLSAELENLADPPALDTGAQERRLSAQHDRDDAQRAIAAAEERVASLKEELEGHEDPGQLVEFEAAIGAVHSEIAAIRKGTSDRRKREGELQAEQARLDELVRAIGPGVVPNTLDEFASKDRVRLALDRHLEIRGEVVERARSASERAEAAERALERSKAALEMAPPPPDVTPLRAAVRAAAKAGPLEAQAAEARLRSADAAADANRCFAELTPRLADIEGLDELVIPSADLVGRFETGEEELQANIAAETRERDRLERVLSGQEARRSELDAAAQAPSAGDLTAARSARDEKWSLVREATEVRLDDAEVRAEQFETAMKTADTVVDARVAHADVVAQGAEIEAAGARIAIERDAAVARLTALAEQQEGLQAEWEALWPEGTPFPAIAAARQWISQRERISDLRTEAARGAREAAAAVDAANRHVQALTARLAGVGTEVPEDSCLEEAISLAESVAEKLIAKAAAHTRAAEAVENDARSLEDESRDQRSAANALASWEQTWAELRDEYGLTEDVSSDDVRSVLRAIDDAVTRRARVADLSRRIEGIDRDRENFERDVNEIRNAVCPDVVGMDPERAAAVLMERLAEAVRSREAMSRLHAEIEREQRVIADAERQSKDAHDRLQTLMDQAQVEREDELADVECRAIRAGELRDQLPACEREVAEAGEESFAALLEAAGQFSGDQLDAELADVERKLRALREDRDAAQQTAFDAREDLERADSSESASATAEVMQQHLASARDLAHRYAVAKLSACLLRETIERYRSKYQGPMLERANELFPMLTCDTFTELYVDWDDAGEPVLVGRDSQGHPLRVEQMSDGTREQLFLALRIAAIERYVEASGAVPVIFDDVFLESDDERAERIFKALAELARRTQVIVLTHHRHLVAIGQRVLDPESLALHDLDGTLGEMRAQARSSKRRAAA